MNTTCWQINRTWFAGYTNEVLPKENVLFQIGAYLVFYAIFLVQIIGNGITIYLLLCTNTRGKTNLFVGSLALCDLISGVNSPVGAYREVPGGTDFIWPKTFHKIYIFIEFYTSFVANFHIAVFASFRNGNANDLLK